MGYAEQYIPWLLTDSCQVVERAPSGAEPPSPLACWSSVQFMLRVLLTHQQIDGQSSHWYVFIVTLMMSWAVTTRIYCSAIAVRFNPWRLCGGHQLRQCANWVGPRLIVRNMPFQLPRRIVNWIITFSIPLFLAHSSSGPYFMFGGFSFLVCVAVGVSRH
jgi:hypothetical protein